MSRFYPQTVRRSGGPQPQLAQKGEKGGDYAEA